ncbi:PilX N-terminal domain-containing pilus assembly protein [Uruburuella suis]|uniref:PilX N-terminal domain-containing pilus assembly protein n=1 Tax=Uruburuella suis TaxID=252130 RepID=A0AAE9KJE1_9NEIS|nr:PilX N-terminal domain-containing pilus assembly protein [Uruburuella suis]TCP10157.1 type IV pilus assembly protein PilX [Uruburuella suis]UOO80463.1 PilX N-terminal domain-containing pilus assembly protein [Uruburuella suis]
MRRPLHLSRAPRREQGGFAFFIVLIMMIVIAFLVVAATQSYNTEMRIGSNDADRKMAMATAEAALRQGEGDISTLKDPTFASNCAGGLCAAAADKAPTPNTIKDTPQGTITITGEGSAIAAWERTSCTNGSCLENSGRTFAVPGTAKAPRYIIEFINHTAATNTSIYRVTARAWGKNANTVVTVQSYVQASDN